MEKGFWSFILVLALAALFFVYWFFPGGSISFGSFAPESSNFTVGNSSNGNTSQVLQFYPNMRYPEKDISYRIQDCSLQREDDMKTAFARVQNITSLRFHQVNSNEEILVTCDSRTKFDGTFFIAGEGGPTNITESGDFNVIKSGGIVLLRDSSCEQPNVATHELFHALGFDHSKNPGNIMYPVSKCNQQIGSEIPNFINQIYAIPSLPDLAFENANASVRGHYLNVSMLIKNVGLQDSKKMNITIYADDKELKNFETDEMEIGSGRQIIFSNILLLKTSVKQIKLSIDYNSEEIKKENNVVILQIEQA